MNLDNRILEVPFYMNHGYRCAQAAMKSVLKAVMPEIDFSFRELEKLTHHFGNEITFPCQVAAGFLQLGIDFQYYVKPNGLNVILDPNFLSLVREKYGKYADDLLARTNIQSLREAVKVLMDIPNTIETSKRPSLKELEDIVDGRRIPICLINYDVFVGRRNSFNGHYLILTGFEDGNIIYHDNGPKGAGPNKRTSMGKFEKAWDLCFFDHNLIVV